MIVLKFGGSSLASPASIRRVASIVLSQVERGLVVVVSAIGETTDQLLKIVEYAARAESYLAWKLQEEVRTYHFCLAEDLLSGERLELIDRYIRQTFRDLHVRILEVCEGERVLSPELRDWVASLGERLSSRIVAAALHENGLQAKHMDSTKLILTDERFTNATPRYWETHARIRWSIPIVRTHVVVLGGFIGATEAGHATTLGRRGSDLTASIVGAAVNADEIQVWKDVDGMLTWDPKLRAGGYRLKNLSYDEAYELAQAGATILHPETIAPAQRLRIPIIIRNTFHPNGEGTRIGVHSGPCFNPVKSVACRSRVTVIELRAPTGERTFTERAPVVERVCRERNSATLLTVSDDVIYLALNSDGRDPGVTFAPDHCMEVHVRINQAIVTLVGQALKRCTVASRLSAFLTRMAAVVLPQDSRSRSVHIVVGQEHLRACPDALEAAFFSDVDPSAFALPEPVREQQPSGGRKLPVRRSNRDSPWQETVSHLAGQNDESSLIGPALRLVHLLTPQSNTAATRSLERCRASSYASRIEL